jgi:hypothetical protein
MVSMSGERENVEEKKECMGRSLQRPKVDMSGLCEFCGEDWNVVGNALAVTCQARWSVGRTISESWPARREAGEGGDEGEVEHVRTGAPTQAFRAFQCSAHTAYAHLTMKYR